MAALRARLGSPESPLLVYLGLLLIVVGFGAIAFTWSKVAGTLAVPLQLPYLVSGGFVGLGSVVVGIAIISVGTKRRDASRREQDLQRVATALREISASLSPNKQDESHEDTEHEPHQ